MNILGIIPARYASSRFPGKPLADIAGKSMIQRVYEQAKKCVRLSEVIVATDDARIFEHVRGFGAAAVMTSADHQSGTDRCAEVAEKHSRYDVVVNIQGDEPYIDPLQISQLVSCFDDPGTQIATLVKKITADQELHSANSPKVIINTRWEAIYFSRSALPHIRGQQPQNWLQHFTYYKHIGIYGYQADILRQITKLPVSALEKAESLEQLRWIENGYKIKVAQTGIETIAIDTPEDLNRLILGQ